MLKKGDSDSFRGSGKRKIINLAEEKDKDTIEGTAIDRFIMNRAGKIEGRGEEDGRDETFPQFSGFRVTLEGMLDFHNMGRTEVHTEAVEIPFDVGGSRET